MSLLVLVCETWFQRGFDIKTWRMAMINDDALLFGAKIYMRAGHEKRTINWQRPYISMIRIPPRTVLMIMWASEVKMPRSHPTTYVINYHSIQTWAQNKEQHFIAENFALEASAGHEPVSLWLIKVSFGERNLINIIQISLKYIPCNLL